jgi:putative membrane protein
MFNIKLNLNRFLIVSLYISLATGCANSKGNQANTGTQLSDANIAAIVVGANKIDIPAGNIALQRSNNEDVKKFANRMITDHKSVLKSAVQLVTKLGVTPVNNDLVYSLAEQSKNHKAQLKLLSGHAFDKSYINHEVAYHQAVIGVIETQLIPSATNAELKALLVSVLPAFKAHLQHCQMIQKELS